MTALRFNTGKAMVSYILQFRRVIEVIGRIMEFGAAKYDDGNWKKGGKPDAEYLNSGLRHLLAWLDGEPYDTDSGCGHLGHAIWNLMALLQLNHPDEVYDKTIFDERIRYWLEEKRKRTQPPAAVPNDEPVLLSEHDVIDETLVHSNAFPRLVEFGGQEF